MSKTGKKKTEFTEFNTELVTEVKAPVKHHTVKWSVKGYSKLPINLYNDSSPINALPPYEWVIRVLKESDKQLGMYLYNGPSKKVELEYEVSLGDLNGQRWGKKGEAKILLAMNKQINLLPTPNAIANELIDLCDDTLIIVCTFNVHLGVTFEKHKVEKSATLLVDCKEKLWADLRTMYETRQHADLTLIVGEEQLLVHKLILCVRSPVFQRMFQHQMGENESNSVKIEDVKLFEMRKLLDFLYSGVIEDEINMEEAYALYYAADKYEVLDLRNMCTQTMLKLLTVNNAIELLTWADRHKDVYMKDGVNNFLLKNFDHITDTDAWSEFMSSETKLALEVTKHYIKARGNK